VYTLPRDPRGSPPTPNRPARVYTRSARAASEHGSRCHASCEEARRTPLGTPGHRTAPQTIASRKPVGGCRAAPDGRYIPVGVSAARTPLKSGARRSQVLAAKSIASPRQRLLGPRLSLSASLGGYRTAGLGSHGIGARIVARAPRPRALPSVAGRGLRSARPLVASLLLRARRASPVFRHSGCRARHVQKKKPSPTLSPFVTPAHALAVPGTTRGRVARQGGKTQQHRAGRGAVVFSRERQVPKEATPPLVSHASRGHNPW